MNWIESANCDESTHSLFFSSSVKQQRIAKSLCQSCMVVSDCLKFAIENDCNSGIYGGLTAKERERYGTN
jgi:WhiB family redox-sensing transcriptional regulator